MSGPRVFSDEELRVAGLRSVDALAEALDAGDREAAAGFLRRLRRDIRSMLQNYDGWEATLLRVIEARAGVAARAEALTSVEDPAVAPERCEAEPDALSRWRDETLELEQRLEAGDDETIVERARALHDEALARHDRGMSRVLGLLSWVGRRFGVDVVEESLGEAMSADMLGNAGFRERAEALMHFTRVHLQPFEVVEDAEKLTFLCAVCPSGGRLLREGHYDPPREGWRVEGPSPLTYGRDELPVYCCHEPVMERASIEKTGAPLFIVEPSERLGEDPCRTYLYKDPADIPERYYRRLGLTKPT